MHIVTVYLDESMKTRELVKLKHEIMSMPYVKDVALSRRDSHDLAIEYEEHAGMPSALLSMMRSRGLHPNVISG